MSLKVNIYECDSTETTNERKVIGGNPNTDLDLNNIKYKWAYNLYNVMLENTWFPKEVNMTDDIAGYKALSTQEKIAYDKALSQIVFMDTLQTKNVTANVAPYITAPEITVCTARLAFEESLHSVSYAVLIDTISENSDEIYQMFRTDPMLRAKNDYIAKVYNDLSNDVTPDRLVLSFVANQALEGIYFQSAFSLFFALADNGKMLATGKMIKFISRDEDTHLTLFQNMINSVRRHSPELFTEEFIKKMREILISASIQEKAWGRHILGDGIFGLTPAINDAYIEYLCDKRLKAIKLEPEFNVEVNPLKHLEVQVEKNGTKTALFESKNSDYSAAGLDMTDY